MTVAGIAAVIGGSVLVLPAASAATAGSAAEVDHVRLEVFSDHRSVGPGETFRVAIVQHIDPEWHTYRVNPGNAGLATKINWTVPTGCSVPEPEWPVPRVFGLTPVVTYRYAGELVSLQEVLAPAGLRPGSVPLSVDVRTEMRRSN